MIYLKLADALFLCFYSGIECYTEVREGEGELKRCGFILWLVVLDHKYYAGEEIVFKEDGERDGGGGTLEM